MTKNNFYIKNLKKIRDMLIDKDRYGNCCKFCNSYFEEIKEKHFDNCITADLDFIINEIEKNNNAN